ncbi:hybrid sensor histidine kinase/response regulator [Pseudomonas mosselii]|uniref:histidine kinase n=1 Tax=Pseudomonas mosselii TaxID=78327 RepID=A0AA42RW80_9PSED|nr:hybrid sensor histidine kinase/response regulator [Pseudomonas mosselii]MDH1629570.1 response regulator [Pseudomonas mosselii]
MPLNRSTVGRLAKVSQRLNFGLLLSLLLGFFFVVSGYWVTYKVLRGELLKANHHFLNFVGRAYDHEVFLLRAVNASSTPDYSGQRSAAQTRITKREEQGAVVYTGQASQYATTFSMVTPTSLDQPARVNPAMAQGIALANVYSDFWARSAFFAPQMFLLDPTHQIDIALPAIASVPSQDQLMHGDVQAVLRQVQGTIARQPPKDSDLFVRWASAQRVNALGSEQLLAYVSMPASLAGHSFGQPASGVVAAALMDLYEPEQIGTRIERQMFDEVSFDAIDLLAPDGNLLLGEHTDDILAYEDGLHLTTSGLLIKRSSGAILAWQALYRISFERLVSHARWQLLSLAGLLAACLLAGWGVSSWYRRRIVVPARSDYSELRHNHDFNQSLLHTVPLALCVLKGDQRITSNSLFSEWLGASPDLDNLLLNWPLYDEHSQPQTGEGCLLLASRVLHVRYAPTHYLDERVLLCTFTDISAHREAAATLVYARQAAEAANAEKSRFVATVSHEIRTPLYGVLGTLELLGLTELSPRQRAYLDTIDSSSELLLHVISDVLDMSKIESGQLLLESTEFDPMAMLEALMRGFSDMAAKKGLALYSCIEPGLPARVIGDGQRLRQVVGNLLNNAIKFTEHGQVAVYLNGVRGEKGQWQLTWQVHDTGPGIDEASRQRLFEPFYQGQQQPHAIKGTGLGLPICIKLCELMGATLRLRSQPGEGSDFSVVLNVPAVESASDTAPACDFSGSLIEVRSPYPDLTDCLCAWLEYHGARTSIDDEPAGELPDALLEVMPQATTALAHSGTTVYARHDFGLVAQAIGKDILVNQHSLGGILQALSIALDGELPLPEPQAATGQTHHLGLRVLLAEDNPVNQTLMSEQLENIGCVVSVTNNGQQALEQLDQQPFDLLLTDVNMPVMDGYALANAVRARGLALPIIGVTANALREEGEHCMQVGMNSWLSKPISIDGLYLCLQALKVKVADEPLAPCQATDQLQVPQRMRALFAQTLADDLKALRQAIEEYDPARISCVLHRLRSALSVARGKALLEASKALEAALEGADPEVMRAQLIAYVERIEATLIAQSDHHDG